LFTYAYINSLVRLAIKYQLQSQGPRLTMADAQILENKWTCLQKLIDMFTHQSDAFLLNHELTEDVPMLSLGDYLEYDQADDIDKSRVPGHLDSAHSIPLHSHTKDGSETNAEDIPLLLTLYFPGKLCGTPSGKLS
jgi:hypothetical protein